jgi:tRNA-modifying protein YgfZ
MEITTPLSDVHIAAGATLVPCFGVGLPEQFSDFTAEYRQARDHAALIDTNFRAVFSLSGPDRVRYLNAVLTSNVRDLAAGQGAIGLLLNSQGHIVAELETLALEHRVIIFAHAFLREKTFATLDKYIIMDDATLTDDTTASGTLAIEGPAAPAIVRELTGLELETFAPYSHAPATLKTTAGTIPCRVIRHSLFGFPGAEFLIARVDLSPAWNAAVATVRNHGGGPVGYRAFNALRLEAGIPWFGADFDERQIPHEAALEKTHISYTKGCYTGQEIVERVRSRGHVNRRRTGLAFSGAEPPTPGTPLTAAGPTGQVAASEAGNVTSAAFSPQAGKPIGMGYLRREHAQPGALLQCGEIQAQVIELPLSVPT